MRILVTGVGGFLGPHVVRHLLEQGDEVAGTYVGEPPDLPGAALHEADLLDSARLAQVVAEIGPDAIVGLAGLSHVGESWRRMADYFRVNVVGTENLLRASAGRRVVLASSAEVYGQVPEGEQPIGERREVDPRTPYALTKAAAERLGFAHGAVVVRSFNLVGPGQAPNFALPAFAAQIAAIARGEQEPVIKVGNLSARRDFVHVADGAAAFRTAAQKGRPGEVYNLASGRAFSIGEALERLMKVSGVAARIEEDPERMRPVDLPLLVGDAGKLKALGWEPRRGLDDALADLWKTVSA
jgi:GDP-4-dehydro-6-deoxy-D-mannose reductase